MTIHRLPPHRSWRCASLRRTLGAALLVGLCGHAAAQDAAQMQARHDSLREQLARSPFNRPLVLQSTQSANDLRGTVYAVVDQPFQLVAPALSRASQWCDLLMLHLNVKACAARKDGAGEKLATVLGRKVEQPSGDGYKVELDYQVPASRTDYLRVQMSADEGPLGTRDYRLALEASPLDAQRTFVHLSYAYAYGTVARLAMEGYLNTVGRGKVGFSVTGRKPDGTPIYIDGVRGVLERNTMRYYLAIEAYLGALKAPAREQQERRLNDWYAATERNALQLHEVSREDYLAMKHHELGRLQAAPAQ